MAYNSVEWTQEQQREIERQHGEITRLTARVSELEGDVHFADLAVREHRAEKAESDELAERLSAAITSAVADLRLLDEVPLGELEDAVKAIADRLADANGERY